MIVFVGDGEHLQHLEDVAEALDGIDHDDLLQRPSAEVTLAVSPFQHVHTAVVADFGVVARVDDAVCYLRFAYDTFGGRTLSFGVLHIQKVLLDVVLVEHGSRESFKYICLLYLNSLMLPHHDVLVFGRRGINLHIQ